MQKKLSLSSQFPVVFSAPLIFSVCTMDARTKPATDMRTNLEGFRESNTFLSLLRLRLANGMPVQPALLFE
jgi:hypothetical protein